MFGFLGSAALFTDDRPTQLVIGLPMLVLCGTEDAMTPPKYAKYLADKIDGARQVIIDGGTHSVAMEKPDEVNSAIEEFLRAIPAAAG